MSATTSQSLRQGTALRRQLLQQGLRLLQIARIEPFREPPVNRSKQFVRLLPLTLVAPEAREAQGGAQLKRFRFLVPATIQRPLKPHFAISFFLTHAQQLAAQAAQLGLPPSFAAGLNEGQCSRSCIQRALFIARRPERLRQENSRRIYLPAE